MGEASSPARRPEASPLSAVATRRSAGRTGWAVALLSAAGAPAAGGLPARDAFGFGAGASNSNPPAVRRSSSLAWNRRMTPYSPS
jgi:hypothetical protein